MDFLGTYICSGFIEDIDLESDKEILKDWAFVLANPWSSQDERYIIEQPTAKALRFYEGKEYKYTCELFVIAYNSVNASLYGRGNTPEESLEDCKNKMRWVQETFNSEN